ncbi:MAG: nucleotidyltransferase domain-containing protein [Chloroflexi bacterium]|nr:nucleotidyltransferase domain-containing protein [Chloroflexota bacterium]
MTDIEQLQTYFANQREVLVAYLFGSRAGDRAAPQSDYDVAVLVQVKLELARRFELASEISRLLYGRSVDLVVLNDAPVELSYAVVATGRCVFERDVAGRVEFEATVLSRYGDVLPMLREQRRELIQGGYYEFGVRRNRAALGQTERVLAEIRAAAAAPAR